MTNHLRSGPATQPLRKEHQELLPHIMALLTAADMVGEVSMADLHREVDAAYGFLTGHLVPHAIAEERALYPVVAKVMGARQATATMSRDHVAIERLIKELGELRPALIDTELEPMTARALRRVLYGLYALVVVHFAKEEDVYFPLLDASLSQEAARSMYRKMEDAAQAARVRSANGYTSGLC
ncbi:MAG: hemerythrin domain-containing protein [Dehalococcoidia bacterium]